MKIAERYRIARHRRAARAHLRQDRRKRVGQRLHRLLGFAFATAGGILVSYGAWNIYAPAGFVVGGILCYLMEHRLTGGEEGSGGS